MVVLNTTQCQENKSVKKPWKYMGKPANLQIVPTCFPSKVYAGNLLCSILKCIKMQHNEDYWKQFYNETSTVKEENGMRKKKKYLQQPQG